MAQEIDKFKVENLIENFELSAEIISVGEGSVIFKINDKIRKFKLPVGKAD